MGPLKPSDSGQTGGFVSLVLALVAWFVLLNVWCLMLQLYLNLKGSFHEASLFPLIFYNERDHCTVKTSCIFQKSKLPAHNVLRRLVLTSFGMCWDIGRESNGFSRSDGMVPQRRRKLLTAGEPTIMEIIWCAACQHCLELTRAQKLWMHRN